LLFVGPHEPYLAYVSDVLPSLGEEGVQTCMLRDLVAEGAAATIETDPEVARLKSSREMAEAIESAVRFYEEPPAKGLTVTAGDADLRLTAADWTEAFAVPGPGTPHNEAREEVWTDLLTILIDRYDGEQTTDSVRAELARDRELAATFNRAWPLLDPADLVSDLWSVPAYLRRCAPWLSVDEVRALHRPDAKAWTIEDLPLLDAARRRLGDPEASRRRQRNEAELMTRRKQMDRVVDDLLDSLAFDDGEGLWSMLRGDDMRTSLVDEAGLTKAEPDRLAGPFAHIVVDEAQELTGAEWQMLLRRCPARSFTIVGDRAQARAGFPESWRERLGRIGLDRVDVATLTVNYRTPSEVMAEAEPVIRAVLPDANVPVSIRSNGIPVHRGARSELTGIVDAWLAEHAHGEGIACVVGDPAFAERPRVRSLSPELAKGLEFDLVVLVDPERFAAVDRYVAMTRATQRLVILTT
jgi:superfamily I DNA/RNA helicase